MIFKNMGDLPVFPKTGRYTPNPGDSRISRISRESWQVHPQYLGKGREVHLKVQLQVFGEPQGGAFESLGGVIGGFW